MNIIHAFQPFPDEVVSSIFLAGPSPRDAKTKSWRPEALDLLKAAGYTGTVFVPEHEGWKPGLDPTDYAAQVTWEEEALNRADCILFWIPRNAKMQGLTTNDEWGAWKNSGKAVLGCPDGATNVGYQKFYADRLAVPLCATLAETVGAALQAVIPGAPRSGGEAQVPLFIWRHPTFQAWLASQHEAGNRLDSARVLWTFRVGKRRERVFSWIIHAGVYIAAEDRSKTNEFVLGRTDMSAVVLYSRPADATSLFDMEVVLVKEFRSPVRNMAGFVNELPGGSSTMHDDDSDADLKIAAKEVEEETGVVIDAGRLRRQGSRQAAATLSAHVVHLFSAELKPDEMMAMREDAASGTVHGIEADSERTYVDVVTLAEAIDSGCVDWTTLGQIVTALARPGGGP